MVSAHIDYVEAAVSKEGLILGLKLESYANMGAYLSNMANGDPDHQFCDICDRLL